MKTLLVTSQKGGSGKTTLTAHLAVEIERAESARVYLLDTDRQASLSTWHGRRDKETPARADIPFHRLGEGLDKLEDVADYCLIDSSPTINEQTSVLIALSDLILIPVRPSPTDLWSVGETVELVKKAGKPFLFVINQAKGNATITAQAVAALSKHGPVAQTFIADRVVYASSMTGGTTAPEVGKGPANGELEALWKEIKGIL